MSLQVAYLGAIVGFVVGVLFNARLFGQTSRAGYHGRSGQFRTKSDAMFGKAASIAFTTIAGFFVGPMLYGFLVTNPFVGVVGVLGLLYVGLHKEVDAWNP